ncbi:copper resistance CopC family protein [Rhodococcus sp. X156]|uniref:copper resistance CopC family protein n=1 Tax=Rhodococcus sp. X156 TaxID=2499145 RepID=UPI001F49A24F|nr:copper resistance CopC family protein [Rhodococcus sp. X156]
MSGARASLRAAGVILLLGLALLVGAGPASAHSYLVSSDPADGAEVATSPAQVALTFNEPLQPAFGSVSVVGPDGNQWSTGSATITGSTATVALTELGPAGRYTVAYRVLSADSHPVTGTVSFTLTTPGTGTPGPAVGAVGSEQPADSDGVPAWPFVVGAAVLVLALGLVVGLRSGPRRSSGTGSAPQ